MPWAVTDLKHFFHHNRNNFNFFIGKKLYTAQVNNFW